MAREPRQSSAARTCVVGSADGRLTRARATADSRLAGIVARDLVGIAMDCDRPVSWVAPPVAEVTLIVTLRDGVSAGVGRLPDDWIGGLDDRPDVVEMPRGHASVDVKLTPLGAYTVLGGPVDDLAGACVSLADVFGRPAAELADRVRETADWAGRFELVEDFLLRRASTGPRPTPLVARAWSLLCATDGRLRVGELADRVGASRRHLTDRFAAEVGLTPKKAARLIRFADVCRRLEADPAGLAEIAQTCGYCDQPHLNRDFRELAATTPGAFVAARSPVAPPAGT